MKSCHCNNMDGPWESIRQSCEIRQTKKTNTIWFHSYVEYKKQTKINEQTELNKNKHVDI